MRKIHQFHLPKRQQPEQKPERNFWSDMAEKAVFLHSVKIEDPLTVLGFKDGLIREAIQTEVFDKYGVEI